MSKSAIPRASASKLRRGRPLGPKTLAIREAVLALTHEYESMTVRQIFYALETRGVIPKDEDAGYRPVQTQVLKMRREGLLDWRFISDATRWQRKPTSFDSYEDALETLWRTYRRNLWRLQGIRVEVWLEKDALAGVVMEATGPWDVPLMVSRGTSSATFLWEAAQAIDTALRNGIYTHIFALYDRDAAGERCARTVERSLAEFSQEYSEFGRAAFDFELLAVTEEQIKEWNLPTRPQKTSDPEAHKFEGPAVELDAIPPDRLIALVDNAIINLIDADAWERERIVEESERSILASMVNGGLA